jgi:cardiolipin synthase (CMP-forming)
LLVIMFRWLNLANLFTLSRLALVPVILRAIVDGRNAAALEWFLVAALTDAIDGGLARNLGQATQFGAYLDPIADKCLLSGIYLALGATGAMPWWLVAMVLGRDIFILLAVLGVMAFTKVRRFPPSRWGKISTFVQIATAICFLVQNIWQLPLFHAIAVTMVWVCAVFTLWSGIHYAIRGTQTVSAH